MQIINNEYILHIVRTAIYYWKWWNEIEISNGLKINNVFINKIDEQFVHEEAKEILSEWANKRSNSHAHRSTRKLFISTLD